MAPESSNGWTGTILHLDLSSREIRREHPPADLYASWVGGKGLAGHYLRPHVTRSWDDPEMPMAFMTGPLVGTASPTSGRMCVMSRSPLTGTVGDASVGGSLGFAFKRAGLDGLVITGRAASWCGIEIADGELAVRDATGLAGMETDVLHERLRDRGAVAAIGPAAENGVLFSNLMVDGSYAAGRSGLGLAFAAKRLKYLAVRGSGRVRVHDPEGLKSAREEIFRLVAASPALLGELGLAHYGTGAIYDLTDARRMMPTANFRKTAFAKASSMNAAAYKGRYDTRRAGCKGCHILCKKTGKDGTPIPEFETMSHFSALLENEDIDVVVRANARCNALGMDTISAASTLACHAELRGRKLSGEEILGLLEEIGRGRGEGRELGTGSFRYAASRGAPEKSMSVKGQELPAYDPRGAYGMALGYATSTRGGCHLRAYPLSHEILRKPVATDRFTFEGKARIVKIAEDLNAVVDSLTACKFTFFAATLEEYAKAYSAVTGVPATAQELLRIGERIYYHERIMNALNGYASREDDLPPRFFEEPGEGGEGPAAPPLDRKEFLETRARYYRVRGLDPEGRPLGEKAAELGLRWEGA